MSLMFPAPPYAPHWTGHFGDDLTASQMYAAAASRRERLADFLRWESLRLYRYADIEVMEHYAAQVEQEASTTQQGGRHAIA